MYGISVRRWLQAALSRRPFWRVGHNGAGDDDRAAGHERLRPAIMTDHVSAHNFLFMPISPELVESSRIFKRDRLQRMVRGGLRSESGSLMRCLFMLQTGNIHSVIPNACGVDPLASKRLDPFNPACSLRH